MKNSEKLLEFWIREIMEAGMLWLFPEGVWWVTLDTSSLPTDTWMNFTFVAGDSNFFIFSDGISEDDWSFSSS